MPRKLKVYKTSIGFYDLAVAAPSMKAAAEAWGSDVDIFKRGFAGETEDGRIVKATMAAPGVVLRRPVGSNGEFSAHAALPKAPKGDGKPKADRQPGRSAKPSDTKAKEAAAREREHAPREKERTALREKQDAAAREKERQRQALERRKEEAERERARKQRERKIAKLNADFEKAEARHRGAIEALARRREELDRDDAGEEERWAAEQRRHRDALNELE
jgi:colicin import membrane protein